MRIAVVSDCVFPTPKPGGHGLGFMVHQIAEGLLARGHDVTLFAKQGSRFSGLLVAPHDADGYEGEAALAREVNRLHRHNRFDVIFDHSHVHHFADVFPDVPALNVFHDIYQTHVRCPVVLSMGQKALMPPEFSNAPVVHNALPIDSFRYSDTPDTRDYALFIGAMSEIKQPMLAVEACARMGIDLVMAGQAIIGHIPFADASNTHYVGEITGAYKQDLIAGARVFLQLGTAESFGLTTVEAGLCGVPVVAWPAGGSLDIIQYGVNGVFVPNGRDRTAAVCDALERAWDMPRPRCRERAERFARVDQQLDEYEALLSRVIMGEWW